MHVYKTKNKKILNTSSDENSTIDYCRNRAFLCGLLESCYQYCKEKEQFVDSSFLLLPQYPKLYYVPKKLQQLQTYQKNLKIRMIIWYNGDLLHSL